MGHVAVRETPCPHCGAELVVAESGGDACGSCRGTLVFAGRFRVRALIGRGSSGAVYSATSGGEEVAVKVRSLAGRGSWNAHERFERSARWLAELAHPGLPRVHAFEPMGQGGRAWLVLERFHGGTLHARVRGARGRLDDGAARALLRGLLEALSALHAHEPPLVHRDVSPHNVMFRDESFTRPVLVDCDSLSEEGASDESTLVGTPGYLAPEQIAGRATAASDVYSAAAIVVFAASGIDVDGHRRRPGRVEPSWPGLSRELCTVLTAMLATDPSARPANAREALLLLDSGGGRETGHAPRRRSKLATVASIALGVTFLGAVEWQGDAPAPADREEQAPLSACRITTVPPGATVYVGDPNVPWSADRRLEKTLGKTPLVVDRGARRPLVLFRPGFRPFVLDFDPAGAPECAFTARLTAE